jgi:sugar O-acyltransferase (sialic acid O-acetyltransferase NeuD family)
MQKKLVLVGCGGFALEVLSYLKDISATVNDINRVKVVGVVDSGAPRIRDAERILGHSIAHWKTIQEVSVSGVKFVIAIGDSALRELNRLEITSVGGSFFTVIHPTAYVASTAKIGEGTIVCPFAFIGPFAKIGLNTAINTYASVGHDAETGPSATLSPYAALNGEARCGRAAFIGSQAVISFGKNLGENSKLSAGSILTTDTQDNALAAGNPAKSRVMFRPLAY